MAIHSILLIPVSFAVLVSLLCLLLTTPVSVAVDSASNEMAIDNIRHLGWGRIARKTAAIIQAGTFLQSAGDTFLIIGANTGSNNNDPIWKYLTTQKDSYSVFVEPIPPLFKQLDRNIRQQKLSRATCVNAAISTTNEPLVLFCSGVDENSGEVIPDKGFPWWGAQTCTSNKTNLYNINLNTRAMVDQYMKEYTVPVMSVRQLIDTYAKDRTIRAIQIDVEGLDDMVVQNLPLSEISPAIIIFEAVHLPKKQMEATFKYLHKYDYYTTRYGQNGVAFKLSILSQIPINMRGAWTKKMLAKN